MRMDAILEPQWTNDLPTKSLKPPKPRKPLQMPGARYVFRTRDQSRLGGSNWGCQRASDVRNGRMRHLSTIFVDRDQGALAKSFSNETKAPRIRPPAAAGVTSFARS